jgi:hypothetical protein
MNTPPNTVGNPTESGEFLSSSPAVTHADRFRDILGRVSYKPDWRFRIGGEPGRYWLQVEFVAADADSLDAQSAVQRGRKWTLSEHMTDSEIVQTAFRATLAAEEHECRETFKVEGVAVLGPHLDLFWLVNLARSGMLGQDARP